MGLKFFVFMVVLVTGCASQNQGLSEEDVRAIVEQSEKKQTETITKLVQGEILPRFAELSHLPKSLLDKQKEAQDIASQKIIIGRVEWLEIEPEKFSLKARVDSGAQTSSMHAKNVEEKEIDGKEYVQFESTDSTGKKKVFLKEVVKTSRVRNSDGNVSKRYVVQLIITLGSEKHQIIVNLNDRSNLNYKFLVGRNILMGRYIVDVSQSRLLGR